MRVGSYQLFERLGEGASGQVYRAVGPDGPAAVKVLRPAAELDDAARARFRREARALAEVRAPELVALADSGVDDELGPWLALPLVPGTTLRALAAGRALGPEAAILLALPVARAAAALHAAGFVHRDLKPENAMATPTGDVIVIDLGLAWGEGMSRWTEEGAAVGSVGYMAPEQIEGREVAAAADVYALGVLLYEWTAGRRPFARARASEEAAAALVGAHAPLGAADRRAGEELAALVGACLAREPAARPTAADVAARLAAMIDWADRDALAVERAAIAADPMGYSARVAPFRARRLERLAREAVAARRPFAALALCDRALAYAPDRAELDALVAEVETAAAAVVPPRETLDAGAAAAGAAGRAGTAPPARADAGAAPSPDRVDSGATAAAAATAAPSTGLPAPRRTAALVVGGALIAAAAVAATLVGERALRPAAPAPLAAAAPAPGDASPGAAPADAAAAATAAAAPLADAGAAPPDPALGDPDLTSSPLADLPPIPLDRLPADAPAFNLDLAARAGEPLIPANLLGGRTPDEAIAAVDARLAQDPGDREAQVGQAMIYIAAGRTRQGLQMLDEAMRLHPDYEAGWAAKSYVEVRRGRWDAAEAAFARALQIDPQDAKSLTNRGILRHRLGHVRAAYQDLRAALAIDPREDNAMYELVQLYQRHGNKDVIGPLLQRIVRLAPDNATAWLDLSLTQPARDARVSVERALALDPASVRARQRLCNVLTMLEDAGAVAACDAAIKLDGTDAEMFTDRGMARYKAGDDAGALADLDRSVALDDSDAQTHVDRAIVRMHQGRRDLALADLTRACALGDRGACAELKNGPTKDAAGVRP